MIGLNWWGCHVEVPNVEGRPLQRRPMRGNNDSPAGLRGSPSGSQPVVMIIDDDPSVCAALRRLLMSHGFDVRVFANWEELPTNRRPPGVCCLILDLHLPGRDGLAFLASLNAAGVRIPAVFITGYGD